MTLSIEQVRLQPYDLPLRGRWISARGGFERRQGWLLELEAGGLRGYGDCAPLPAAGTESVAAAAVALERVGARAVGLDADALLAALAPLLAETPAARYALDCARLDLLSQADGRPLRQVLTAGAREAIQVNAMLGTIGSITGTDMARACAEGFKVLKIKVGLADPDQDIARITALAQQLPRHVRLRLDANGAWTLAAATRMIEALEGLPIESLEEPLRQPDAATLDGLQSRAGFPLARDESLRSLAPDVDLATLGVRRLVLKPAVIGGLERTLDLAARARAAGIQVVITSLVESAAGLWPTSQLAAAIASPLAHGLATADWLAEDLGAAPRPRQGRIHLPQRPGSGFVPDRMTSPDTEPTARPE